MNLTGHSVPRSLHIAILSLAACSSGGGGDSSPQTGQIAIGSPGSSFTSASSILGNSKVSQALGRASLQPNAGVNPPFIEGVYETGVTITLSELSASRVNMQASTEVILDNQTSTTIQMTENTGNPVLGSITANGSFIQGSGSSFTIAYSVEATVDVSQLTGGTVTGTITETDCGVVVGTRNSNGSLDARICIIVVGMRGTVSDPQISTSLQQSLGKMEVHRASFTASSSGFSLTGALSSSDAPSHARQGRFADYYRVNGSGQTEIEMTGFDTYLYLYDHSLNLVAEDDDGGPGLGSLIRYELQAGQSYYLEATSFAPDVTGPYQLIVSNGSLTATTSPWGSGNSRPPASLVVSNGFEPRLSPNGQRIVFTRLADYGSSPRSELWLVNTDGSGLTLLSSSSSASDFNPRWEPDGQRIMFLRKSGSYEQSGRGTLYRIRADRTSLQSFFPYDQVSDFCFWIRSSSTTEIVADGATGLWMSMGWPNLIGTAQRRQSGGHVGAASSPSTNDPAIALFDPTILPQTMGLRLFNPATLTEVAVYNGGKWPWPCMSPSGSKIAAGADGGYPVGIYMMNADGSSVEQLTQGVIGGSDHQPSWVGSTIAFVRVGSGGSRLHGDIYKITEVLP